MGEIASYDLPSADRVRLWLRMAPRIGSHVFVKLFAHGAQELNAKALLGGGLELLFRSVRSVCEERGMRMHLVSAWEMFQAIEALREQRSPSVTG